MATATETTTTQAFAIYVRATPETIWEALTTSAYTERYGYGGRVEYDLQPGGAYRAHATAEMVAHGMPEVMVEGEVVEANAPTRLVQTWHALFGPQVAAEASTRLTFEIEPFDGQADVSKLTLTHELDGAPVTASLVSGSTPESGGGWSFVLSDLKTLLESGSALRA